MEFSLTQAHVLEINTVLLVNLSHTYVQVMQHINKALYLTRMLQKVTQHD